MTWADEIRRALWGLACSWPLLHLLQGLELSSFAVAGLLTCWMVPVWRLYTWLAKVLR